MPRSEKAKIQIFQISRSGVDWEDADYDYNGYDYDGYDYDGKEWDVCWAFNTAKGCRKGGWCEWRHAHYEE